MNITVIGSGGWGTTLAIVANERGHRVTLWSRRAERAKEINDLKENIPYLPGIAIPTSINITSNDEAIRGSDIYIIAVPSQTLREVISHLKPNLNSQAIFVTASKGIERHSLKRMTEILNEILDAPWERLVALSGPSHAEEVARKIPTVLVAASASNETARIVQEALLLPYLRIYTSNDVVGVELSGALKNVIAICAGILDGEGFGDNTVAALVTRGLAEMRRLGVALGADEQTFSGVAGLGDLVVTCLSKHSRNLRVGIGIGQGRSLDDILSSMSMIAEGVWTTESAKELAAKQNIEMPIVEAIYKILFEHKNYREATTELMTRETKDERW
ncbi:MAG TPA: NAD(P)H-dependent glycerol-3-phosphate dehydrogenase [Candidatus Kapabacteria bacterium]|nr:NAD(P)H-dependent glycerol-3-phosphate dehydrogenase [Candidatus Kapabacteria bacterium]